MQSWKKYKEDFVLMLESGFIAVNQADEDAGFPNSLEQQRCSIAATLFQK